MVCSVVIAARDAAWCALRDKSNTCGVATWGGEGLRVVRYMLVYRGGALGAVWCVDRCVVCRSLSSAGSRLCSHARAYTREQIPHVRPLPPKKIFLPPFRGARFLAERPFSARHRKPCYDFCVGRPGRQAQRPTGKPLQEVDNVQEGNGMNAQELLELKAALLKVERLEVLAILRDAESLDEAIKAIEQRKNG